MATDQQDPEPRPDNPCTRVDWEETFLQHHWDYLAAIGETPRYSVVAGYIHKLVRSGHILDIGCGEGVLIDYLDLSRVRYTGFDVSPTAIERARQRYDVMSLFSTPMEIFTPPENEKYDIVVFNEVLSQVEHPIKELDRFSMFLKPGGYVIVSLFQGRQPEARGAVTSRLLEAELAARQVAPVAVAEVLNRDTGFRWKIYCLLGAQNDFEPPTNLTAT